MTAAPFLVFYHGSPSVHVRSEAPATIRNSCNTDVVQLEPAPAFKVRSKRFAPRIPALFVDDVPSTSLLTAMSEPRYIGFPEYDNEDDLFFILLESKHRLFRIILKEDLELPHMPHFPAGVPEGYRVEEVSVSGEMDAVLGSTRLVGSG